MSFTRLEPTSIDTTETFSFRSVSVNSNTVTNNLTVNNSFSTKSIEVTSSAALGPVGNLKITGGSANQSLLTDGAGNLRWGSPSVDSANTVISSSQPNITSVGTLTSFAANNGTLTTNVPYTFTSNWNASGTTFSALEVRVTDTASTTASSLLNLTVGGNSRFSVNKAGNISANNISLTGNVSATFVSGTISTASQPNITSIGQLSVLGVTSNINAGNVLTTGSFYGALQGPIGATTPNTGIFTNVTVNNNIAVLGNVTANIATANNANLGNAVRANFFIGDGGLLTNITVSSVSSANTVISPAQPNITSVGTLANLVVSGQIDTARVITTSSIERFAVVTAPGTTVSRSYAAGTVVYFKSMVNNFGINFTSVPTDNNSSIVFVLILSQGSTPYSPSSFSIDGVAQTVRWLGGSPPVSMASKVETYSYICLRESSGWIVTGQMNSYG